jgi:Recombination endonuclease VII
MTPGTLWSPRRQRRQSDEETPRELRFHPAPRRQPQGPQGQAGTAQAGLQQAPPCRLARGDNHEMTPCGNCGVPTQAPSGFCQRTPKCKAANWRLWKRANPEKAAAIRTRYQDSALGKATQAIANRRNLANRTAILALRKAALWQRQAGICKCGDPLDAESMHLDHDHRCCPGPSRESCGSCDRAVLHPGCNIAIGQTGESPERLRTLATWLELEAGS